MTSSPLLVNALIAFGAFQALFISCVFLFQRKGPDARKYFSVFLIIEGLTLVERLLAETGLMSDFPHLLGISYPLSFIKPPVLLFTAWAIANPKFKLKKQHVLHFIPFLLLLVMNIPFYLQDASAKVAYVENFISYVPDYGSFNFFLFLSFYLYIGIYIIATMRSLSHYRSHVKNNKLANWYNGTLLIYSTVLSITLVYFLILPSGMLSIPYFNITSMLIMTFLVQSIAYRFFVGADVFTGKSHPSLDDIEQRLTHEKRITDQLQMHKAHLDHDLNLGQFSKAVELSAKQVSDVVNQRFGCSFKELINRYRVEEAKYLMQRDTSHERQLIDIALDCGFNNKVSFYRAFKKHTGKSPSEFWETETPSTQTK